MSRLAALTTLALLCALQAAHAGGAPPDRDLQRLTADLAQLEADPNLGQFGDADRLKAHQALDALVQAGLASKEHAQVLHIAESRVAAAHFAAEADLAERQQAQLDHEHDRILLEASRRDADRAHKEAERLRMQNTAREEEAQRAEAERQVQAQQAAGIASDESDQARALAEARAKEAALARQEAALSSSATPSRVDPNITNEPRGQAMTMPGMAFVPGKAGLRNDAKTKARIGALLAFVRANQGAMIRIEGHTDNHGNPQDNLDLSQLRADAVRNLLRAAGVPANRMQAVGLGAEQPVASNATAQGRERNRTVEVIVLRGSN